MSVTNINLLPWREELKQKRQKQLLNTILVGWAIAGGLAYLMVMYWDGRIDHQNDRNKYLETEISSLEETIKEIEDLKEKRDEIVDRLEVIQELQSDRAQIVHVFDDLVQKMPEGVYLDQINKKGDSLDIQGFAQANARVSSLMRNLDASSWFKSPQLKIVRNTSINAGLELSQFNLKVSEERSNSEDEEGQ